MSVAFEGKCSGCGGYAKDCICSVSPTPIGTFTGSLPDTGLSERTELVKAIRNRCEIYLLLVEMANTESLIPTVLEDLYEDCQEVLEYCVERADD